MTPGDPATGPEQDGAQDLAVDAYWATARKRAGVSELTGVRTSCSLWCWPG